ncbi:MAG: flavodoxin family protein [Lachnospiraceae bacterium]|nr:flavodoxin family protein [Lachnospiraceae bacterium]
MNLLIHDLGPELPDRIREEYDGWTVISDNGTILPCTGCFCCWHKTPGQCILRDGYEHMGTLIHRAEEVTVISRYTYGGFSAFVKNIFDRSLGYVLPQFEIVKGQTHHKKRYEEKKPFTFIFYGTGLDEEKKQCAARYVRAVCTNIRGYIKDLVFRECDGSFVPVPRPQPETAKKVLLLNGSERSVNGNSAKLAARLLKMLKTEAESIALKPYAGSLQDLFPLLDAASDLVLCMPLYVDGLPSQVIRFMEYARHEYHGTSKRVYVLANMGLYEAGQLENLFEAVRQWCGVMQFEYCGGLGLSAGEFIGVMANALPITAGPLKTVGLGLQKLAGAIDTGTPLQEVYTGPRFLPRPLFVFIANQSWNGEARRNGIRPADLYRRL